MIQEREVTKQDTHTYKETVKVNCDLCGKEHKRPHRYTDDPFDRSNWATSTFGVDRVVVMHERGSCYPDGPAFVRLEFDICPDCFINKLQTWLTSHGCVKPRVTEVNE